MHALYGNETGSFDWTGNTGGQITKNSYNINLVLF